MSDPYGPLGPSAPGYQEPPSTGPYGDLGPSVPGQTGAGTPVVSAGPDIAPESQLIIRIGLTGPISAADVPNIRLPASPPGFQIGTPSLSADGRTLDVPATAKGAGGSASDLLRFIISLLAAITAFLASLVNFGKIAGIAYFTVLAVKDGIPQTAVQTVANLTKIADNLTKQAAAASGTPPGTGTPWLLIIGGGALLLLLANRR